MSFFERRKAPRTAQPGQALVVRGSAAFLVEVGDLSKGGACVKRPRGWSLNIGDAVLVYLLNDVGPAMTMEAKVVWYRDDEIGLHYV
jgi:hypothetical protein